MQVRGKKGEGNEVGGMKEGEEGGKAKKMGGWEGRKKPGRGRKVGRKRKE